MTAKPLPKHVVYPGVKGKEDSIPEGPEETVHSHRQSRLLSKKQLSDMAFSIRELGKKLAHIKLKLKVQNIFILGKAYDDAVVLHTRDLVLWLLERDHSHRVYVEDILEQNDDFNSKNIIQSNPNSYGKRLRYWNQELCAHAPQIFDIVIALGGDGTVLYASYLFQRVVPPVIAFSMGSLGFLTKFDFDSRKDTLEEIFTQGFNVNLRLRFEATVMRKTHEGDCKGKDIVEEIVGEESGKLTHQPDGSHHILNEVVLDRGPNGSKFLQLY
jgi:NAD+ kinase